MDHILCMNLWKQVYPGIECYNFDHPVLAGRIAERKESFDSSKGTRFVRAGTSIYLDTELPASIEPFTHHATDTSCY